jgi:tRNA pseudouridine55 synthase
VAPRLDGVLVVDKPVGPTSHDVVARVRRATGSPGVGHTGTLDPLASGVLALVIGRATRLAQFLSAADKTYEAAIRLGVSTDTYDALGTIVPDGGTPARSDPAGVDAESAASGCGSPSGPWPARGEIERALERFVGEFLQTPPPFSAKKLAGVPAHELARRRQAIALAPVRVRVHALEVLAAAGDELRLRLTCSAGFYVRSLAHDLGVALGCGAHLAALRRTCSGEFELAAAVSLEAVERDPEEASRHLVPMSRLLPGLPAAHVTAQGAVRASHGNQVAPDEIVGWTAALDRPGDAVGPGSRVRVIGPDGGLLAIATACESGPLRPTVVLA